MEKTLLNTNFHPLPENQMEKKKYDLVFIGGGPSTLAFIAYLFQKKHATKVFGSTNILIIEKSDNFGSGCLGKYGINTNTSSEGFPRLIYYIEGGSKEKTGKLALSPSKKSMKASKNYNKDKNAVKEMRNKKRKLVKTLEMEVNKGTLIYKTIPLFNELCESSAVQTLIAIGNRPAPLSLVGYFLDCLGNFITCHIYKEHGKNILLNNAEVKSVKFYNNEEFGITVKKGKSNSVMMIKTKYLVFSTGGKQKIENAYYKWILSVKGDEKVFNSDFILQEEGYRKIQSQLKLINGKKKIVIIGGSHSGFSSAWILLNDPATYRTIIKGEEYQWKREHGCKKCLEDCICFGRANDKNWSISEEDKINRDELEIIILYRDHIRVYYPSQEEALSDNYTCYDPKEALNKQGRVYPFIGIRGDAKDLYNKIIRGEENRVQLIHTQTNEEQHKFIKDADVVIWACGYITNNIPIYDSRNNLLEFYTDEVGSLEVNKELQLLTKNKIPYKNLYGIGQGYSTKTPEVINGKKARADSINIYNSYIAGKLYKSLEYFFHKNSMEYNKSLNMNNNLKRRSEFSADHNTKQGKNSLLLKAGKQIFSSNTGIVFNNKENITIDKKQYGSNGTAGNGFIGYEQKPFASFPLTNFNKNFSSTINNNIGYANQHKYLMNFNLNKGSPKGIINKNLFVQTDVLNELKAKRVTFKHNCKGVI